MVNLTLTEQRTLMNNFKVFFGRKSDNVFASRKGVIFVGDTNTDIVPLGEDLYGYDFDKMNASFHKSWKTVCEISPMEHYREQVMHYIGTYGMESVGMETINILPFEFAEATEEEKLTLPKVTLLKAADETEIKKLICDMFMSGIALNTNTIESLKSIVKKFDVPYTIKEVLAFKNRDARLSLMDYYGYTPLDSEEFVKWLVYSYATLNTTLVKNVDTIKKIYLASPTNVETAIKKLIKYYVENGMSVDAEFGKTFNRYKYIWMAFHKKGTSVTKSFVNRISNASKKYHKPLNMGILDKATQITEFDDKTKDAFIKALDNATLYRAVRILNAVRYNFLNAFKPSDKQYKCVRVRNGKEFAYKTKTNASIAQKSLMQFLFDYINNRVRNNIYKLVEANDADIMCALNVETTTTTTDTGEVLVKRELKKIEKDLSKFKIVLPTSEKDFVGNFPSGSSIVVNGDNSTLICGVHWYNGRRGRVDLDLHARGRDFSIGWSSDYKNSFITFSGDVTDAPKPNGASEYITINTKNLGTKKDDVYIDMSLCNYTSNDCDYRFFFGSVDGIVEDKKHIITPSSVIYDYNDSFENEYTERTLGTIKIDKNTHDITLVMTNSLSNGSYVPCARTEYDEMKIEAKALYADSKLKAEDIEFLNEYVDYSNLSKGAYIKLFA